MGRSSVVAGTSFEGRASIIKRHCRDGRKVILKREPNNQYDANAIAVYLEVPRIGGLFGKSLKQIGFIKASTAKSLAKKMDSGVEVTGFVRSFYAPAGWDSPRVSLTLEY